MKIVIAPDSFKESLSSLEAAVSIEKGFKAVLPDAEYIKIPVADGGEGTVRALVDATAWRNDLQKGNRTSRNTRECCLWASWRRKNGRY